MRHAWALAALLVSPSVSSGQAPSVLHVTVTLLDAAQTPVPVPRHALLVSDNPASSEPRRVVTATNGTVDIRLRPGSYTVESDRPFAFLGRAYQWTQMVDVVAGRDATLALTAENAEVVPLTASASAARRRGGRRATRHCCSGSGRRASSRSGLRRREARASSSTHGDWSRRPERRRQGDVGRGAAVANLKVPARVLYVGRLTRCRDLWVDAGVVAATQPLPLPCPPAASLSMDDGEEIVTIAAPLRAQRRHGVGRSDRTSTRARSRPTCGCRLAARGGPVFNDAGALVGLTHRCRRCRRETGDATSRSSGSVTICEAVAASRQKMSGAAAARADPTAGRADAALPSRRARSARREAARARPTRSVASSSEFDVAFITPPMVHAGRLRSDRTGGRSTRSPEAEARIGRLTEFSAWSEYFAELPPVLIVRVTPKMVEGFWKRLAREAARTQGAALPAFKDFKTDFLRMRASCAGAEVVADPSLRARASRLGEGRDSRRTLRLRSGVVRAALQHRDAVDVFRKGARKSRRAHDRRQGDRADLAGLRAVPCIGPVTGDAPEDSG